MKRFLPLLISALAMSVVAQESENTYGKTEAEILKMGIEKWETFFTSKAGDSTAGMAGGYGIYADVASKRNERLEKDSPRATLAKKVHELLSDYGASTSDVGRNISGGGTIWNIIDSEKAAEMEEITYLVLSGEKEPAKHMVVSTVKKDIQKLGAEMEKTHADKNADYFKYDVAKPAFDKLNKDFSELVSLAKGMNRSQSDHILTFCDDYVKSATSLQ